MSISTPYILFGALISAILYRLYVRLKRISIAHIPGPESPSFILGNLAQLVEGQAAETEFKWQGQYGDIVKFKGIFGEDRLLISDPKALQYIYQTSGYRFVKQPERREISRLTSGRGIVWAEGETHKRQRKVMLPGFSGSEARYYQPVFSACAARMVEKWKGDILSSGQEWNMINVPHWASRCTLDAIGEGAITKL
ncbi:hypothetical protein C0989_005437 [Termitomyces sp. Mn162]|nr:hypothetical protein C0989_005437 [Termitomyces sp. Mn162]